MTVELTDEQTIAVDAFAPVFAGRARRRSIGGYAGTGKTTVVKAIIDRYGAENIAVCTPTGKAAHVLRAKGVDAITLHSLIYLPRKSRNGDLQFVLRSGRPAEVVIVDEASMLSARLVNDLESKIRHVLYVGDHGQLEPIGDDPGIMRRPDVCLEQIHRQAEGSPIIQFAHHVRQGYLPASFGPEAHVTGLDEVNDILDFDIILCGYNDTRRKCNEWVRKHRGFTTKLPSIGEAVICLRNDRETQVWNGMTATVTRVDPARCVFDVDTDDGPRRGLRFDPAQFGALTTLDYEKARKGTTLWDWGYCITAHRSQGSSWQRVAVVEEIAASWSAARWRYTAATRAAKELRWILK
jgi:ATP-dependent exoDNAse (exonuclease V) alpha subunit